MSADFRTRLAALGLSQRAFARVIARLSGQLAQYRTLERWAATDNPPDAVLALLTLMERHPEGWREPDDTNR